MYDLQQAATLLIKSSKTMSGRYPRQVVTDLGSEFDNNKVRSFCQSRGIQLQFSPARAKEMNGIAEKSVDTVKNHVRTMLLASGVPDIIGWSRAVMHHIFVWNRTHIGRHTGMTPREATTGKESSILNFGVFGCDAFVHQDRTQRDTTFSAKALPGIYLGHDMDQNCPVVRMLHSGKTMCARDVIFREGSFDHMKAEKENRPEQVESIDLNDSVEDASDTPTYSEQRKPVKSILKQKPREPSEADSGVDDDTPDNNRQYRVKAITDKRVTPNGQVEYCVKWFGYSAETWEPAATIEEDAPGAVSEYTTFVANRTESRNTRSTRSSTRAAAAAATTAASSSSSGTTSVNSNAAVDGDDESSDDERNSSEAVRSAAARRL
jgi:hypothetical protein